MANYQSIPRRFNKPTSSINHAYIDATLKDKQNTIDTNFGILQQTIESTLGQDLIRESDRDYLKDKVRGVLNTLDNTDAIRFDSKKSRFLIQDSLSEAAKDPEVLKQVANTKKIRQIQDFYQKRLNKGDINQQNFQYAYQKSGINSYLNEDSDDMGDFSYSEYVDVDAKLDETARKLKAANPNEKITIQNPVTGEIVSKKVSMITPEEMRGYLRIQLNADDLKQLEIDGAMLYGMDDQAAIQYRDSLISENNKNYLDKVRLLENYRDNGNKTKGEIDQINSQIKILGKEKSDFERNLIGQRTAEAIGGQQLIQDKVNLFSNLYTKNGPESITYDKDFLKRMRDANSAANVNSKLSSTQPSSEISTITVPTNLPEEVNPYKDSLNRTDKTLRENSMYLKDQFNKLSPEKKELVQDTINQIKSDPEVLAMYKGQPISNETLQLEAINRLGPNFFTPDVAKELRSRIQSNQAIQKGIENTTNEFVKSKVLENNVFDQLFNQETNLTMATPQGDVNIQRFLQDNGVTDYDSYKSFIGGNSIEAKKLRATIALQSMSLTSDNPLQNVEVTDDAFYNLSQTLSNIGGVQDLGLTESEYRIMRQATHDLTGESLDETYDIQKSGNKYNLTLKNQNTSFYNVINRTNQLFQEGRVTSFGDAIAETVGFDIDRTVRNEGTIRGLFSEDNYEEFAEQNLNLLDKTVVGNNSIRLKGNIKKQVGPLYKEVLQYVDNVTFDKRLPIDIYKKENGELLITQIVQDETALDNKDSNIKKKIRQGIIQANDVKKMTSFNNEVDLITKENTFRSLEDVSGSINKMSFIGNNREQVEGLNRLYDRNNKGENTFRLLSTEKTARDLIFNPNVESYLNSSNEGLAIKSQFEDFVTNTQNYKLDFTKGVDSDYEVVIKDQEGNSIGSIPLNKNIPVEVFEKAYQGTPQVFLSLFSKSRVDKYMQSIINGR